MSEHSVQQWQGGSGPQHQAIPTGPLAEVVVGAGAGLGLGVVAVTVPVGAAMPDHAHGGSTTLLIPQSGRLRLADAETGVVTELEPGTLATIPVGRHVRLENAGSDEAQMLVVLSPPDFADAVTGWPVAQAAAA